MQKQITGRIVVPLLLFALTIMTALPAFADSGAIPQRSQVEEKYKWDLTAFFPSDSAWEAAYTYLENNISRLGRYKGKLATSANSLYGCLELRDSLGTTVVVVTHELASIFAIGNNSVFLDPETRTMIATGDPKSLRDHSDDPKVRRFLTRGDSDQNGGRVTHRDSTGP